MVRAAQETSIGGNGHDSGQDGDSDSLFANAFDPSKEVVGIVKHLSDNEAGALVDLLLEVLEKEIFVLVVITALRVPRHTDIEMAAIGIPDVLHEVLGVVEAALSHLPLFLVSRRIATEGEDVGAAGLVSFSQSFVDLLEAHIGTGKVHAGFHTEEGLGLDDHLVGQLGDATTSSPGDVDELGAEHEHALHTVVQVLDTLSGLRREVLEGERGLMSPLGLLEHVPDMHVGWRRRW